MENGNSLFIVLDPYADSSNTLYSTLGKKQYLWLSNTLESSTAKYKFIFSNHIITDNKNQRHGGISYIKKSSLHKLFVNTNVTAFFYNYDGFYAQQELDSVIYQLVPKPGSIDDNYTSKQDKYIYNSGMFLNNSGCLKIDVTSKNVTVNYIKSLLPSYENKTHKNGDTIFSYTIPPK